MWSGHQQAEEQRAPPRSADLDWTFVVDRQRPKG
jgi:hypothetical protein